MSNNINFKEHIIILFQNYHGQAMIKCICNREFWQSGSIYILQEIPNHQLCTVPGTVCNKLSISRTQGPKTKLPESRGAPPHGTPRLAWSPMWVSGYITTFLPHAKHGYKSFPIQEPTNLPGLLVPNGSKQPSGIIWSKVKTTNGP